MCCTSDVKAHNHHNDTVSQVIYLVPLYSKCTGALTFENFCSQDNADLIVYLFDFFSGSAQMKSLGSGEIKILKITRLWEQTTRAMKKKYSHKAALDEREAEWNFTKNSKVLKRDLLSK